MALQDDIDGLPLVISPGITPQINGNAIIIHRTLKALRNLLGHTPFGQTIVKSANAEEARGHLGAGTSSLVLGISSTTAAAGDDPRFSDARTPVAHNHILADIVASGIRNGTTFLSGDGTWKAPADVSGEVAYAELNSVINLPTSDVYTDIPGLAITFATSNRPAMVHVHLSGVACPAAGVWKFRVINGASIVMAEGACSTSDTVQYPGGVPLEFRVPTGTASTQYKVQASRFSGSATGLANPFGRKAFIQATRA
ncbi:hypothetical protein HQO24_10510 [Rhodococcus fascians]|nr:hypothetical protein [Rhodococcus fascians]MBY4396888.1 hypothetical protein [Rhodococcus fascians]MBY4407367.1 hypothetical protein [Rhodococcus fascians]MBY4421504.1 hypothetical protein [Rhodococcus fascians]MBY4460743.1 hypothetical protein [Rhodococcus fascians]